GRLQPAREVDIAGLLHFRNVLESERERRPAGQAGRGEHAAAAVGNGERLDERRAVRGEVLERERAALVAHVLRERPSDVAAIECPRALMTDGFKRGRKRALVEALVGAGGPIAER